MDAPLFDRSGHVPLALIARAAARRYVKDVPSRFATAIAALALATTGTIACTAVLGLDKPTLDPCAETACADAASDADAQAQEAGRDGAVDAGSDAPIVGVRCGGGSFGVSGCTGATPVCCQTSDDAGTRYACGASGACAGYAIACASNADCPGNDVCCHQATQMKCVGASACNSADLVCEPNGPSDQCPAGWKCTARLTNAGVASPYFGCAP